MSSLISWSCRHLVLIRAALGRREEREERDERELEPPAHDACASLAVSSAEGCRRLGRTFVQPASCRLGSVGCARQEFKEFQEMLSSDTDGGRSRHTGRRGGTTARIARRPRGAGKEAAGSGGATRGRGTRRARYLRDGWEHLINEREQLRRELRRGVRPEGGAGPVRVRQGQPRLHRRGPELPPLHRVPRRRQRRRGEGGPPRRLVRDALRRHRYRRRRLLRPRGGTHRARGPDDVAGATPSRWEAPRRPY